MLPTSDRALYALRQATGNRADDDVVLVEVATLLAACRAMEDYAQCESTFDIERGEMAKEHSAEMGEIETAARDLIAAVEKMLSASESVDTTLAALKALV